MTQDAPPLSALLERCLTLLQDHQPPKGATPPSESLPEVLEQCRTLSAERSGPAPLRSIHHFACSGGTLITKCLGALPNVVTLSEIDPLSLLQLTPPGRPISFAPTDLIRGLRHSPRRVEEETLLEMFNAGLKVAQDHLTRTGQSLLLRDHAHSQFCTRLDPALRPTLYEILNANFPMLSLLTVRHPLDSFLSLRSNGWVHFKPNTLDEYCRRYLIFLDRHTALDIVKYEDFVTAPETVLAQMSTLLDLPFTPAAMQIWEMVRMSGDSGRTGQEIALRPRRALPPDLDSARSQSPAYRALCARLSYEP